MEDFDERRSGKDRRQVHTMINPDKERRIGQDRRMIKHIEKMEINKGDVIIIRMKEIKSTIKQTVKAISIHVRKKGAFAIFADYGTKIDKLNERKMYELGWIRKDQLEDEEVLKVSERFN